jgi:hypothetical protein
LHDNRDRFATVALGSAAQARLGEPSTDNPLLDVPWSAAVKRMAVNRMNDTFSWF